MHHISKGHSSSDLLGPSRDLFMGLIESMWHIRKQQTHSFGGIIEYKQLFHVTSQIFIPIYTIAFHNCCLLDRDA